MRLLFFSLLVIFVGGLQPPAQAQKKRIEVPLTPQSDYYYAVPMGNDGVVVVSQDRNTMLGGENVWTFTHYNAELEQVSQQKTKIKNWIPYMGFDTDGENIYLAFHRSSSTKYHFAKFDMKEGKLTRFTRESLRRFEISRFKTMDGQGFLMGEVKKTPTLLHFDLEKEGNLVKVLPVSTTRRSESPILVKDTVHQLINFSFIDWSHKKSTLVLQSYDPSGEKLVQLSVPNHGDDNPLMGKLSITDKGNALVVGTYSVGGKDLSSGIFVAEFNGEKQLYYRRYNFMELEHFFDYLPKKKQDRLKRKQRRKQRRDKELELEYRLLVHDLVYRGGEFLLLAEAYYPTYRYKQTGFRRQGLSPGRGVAQPRMVFDGYQYTHAVVAAFQEDNGQLLWDNSFELTSPKTFTLRQKVHTAFSPNNELLMTYSNRGSLRAKVIRGNEVVEQTQTVSLLEDNSEVVKRTFTGTVSYWHNNHFLAWGKQRIKESGEDRNSKRNVFYLNRVPFNALGR